MHGCVRESRRSVAVCAVQCVCVFVSHTLQHTHLLQCRSVQVGRYKCQNMFIRGCVRESRRNVAACMYCSVCSVVCLYVLECACCAVYGWQCVCVRESGRSVAVNMLQCARCSLSLCCSVCDAVNVCVRESMHSVAM